MRNDKSLSRPTSGHLREPLSSLIIHRKCKNKELKMEQGLANERARGELVSLAAQMLASDLATAGHSSRTC